MRAIDDEVAERELHQLAQLGAPTTFADPVTVTAGFVMAVGAVALLWSAFSRDSQEEDPVSDDSDDDTSATPAPTSEASPLPEQPVPSTPTPPAPTPHAVSSAPYVTAPEDIGEPVWMPFGSDKEIAVLIPDRHTGGYAHASYASTLAAAQQYGASMPTHEDMITLADQAKAAGLELDPVILPGASPVLVAEGAKPGDPAMDTERWVTISDDLIRAQLTSRNWDGKTAVANAGKVWIAGAPPGRAYLMGWRQKNGVWIQSGSTEGQGPHDASHCDYSMLLTLVRPRAST